MSATLQVIDYSSLAEERLVALAHIGDREAFRTIMTRYNQRLFRIARSVVRDHDEAQDVLQDAYTRAFSNFSGFRGEASLFTWLTAITLNEARARLRRRRTMVGLEAIEAAQAKGTDVLMFPAVAEMASPETEMQRSQIRSLLESAIADLPESFRLVLIMRDIEECSIEETAAVLGLKPETVRTRLFRARKQMRRLLNARLSSAMSDLFPFLGAKCAATTEVVLNRLAPQFGWVGGGQN